MRTWFIIVDFVGLFCLLVLIDIAYTQKEKFDENYNEQRLAKSIEYASEAAFAYSTGATDNGITYNDNLKVLLNSQDTLEIFDSMMELNYNLAICEESDVLIEDSIGAAVLACDDGYYITSMSLQKPNVNRLHWSPKLPYSIAIGNSTYSVCLTSREWIKVEKSGGSVRFSRGDTYAEIGNIITNNIRKSTISTTLTNAVTRALNDNSLFEDYSGVNLYLPSEQTLSGINSIVSPSFIVIITDAGFAGCKRTENAAITGLRVIKKVRVIGYIDHGIKKYSYEFQGAANSNPIYEYFDSAEEAAESGYIPDYKYIMNPMIYS